MSCYFSELSALLACLFKGTKYGLDRSHADLDWLAGKLVWHLAGWAVGKPSDALVYVASLLLRNKQLEINTKRNKEKGSRIVVGFFAHRRSLKILRSI